MVRHQYALPKAVAAVEFLRHRTPAAHHFALVGLYRQWPQEAALDRTLEALVTAPAGVAPELLPHYWRALGHLAGRYWYENDRSLSQLDTHLHVFVPRLDPSVQRPFLQGVGQALFAYPTSSYWVPPVELERFLPVYQEALLEGWGIQLGEDDHFTEFPWHGQWSPVWMAATRGLSARSVLSIQQGKALFDAFFEGPASSALEPALRR